MKVFRIEIDLSRSGYTDTIEHTLWSYLVCLHGTTQIANEDPIFILREKILAVHVTCPEPDALLKPCPVKYVEQMRQKLEEQTGAPLKIEAIGQDPQEEGYSLTKAPNSLILCYGQFSPLICGETYKPVPLYHLPLSDERRESYDDIRNWEYNFKRLYGLWISSTVGEKFALRQLQHAESTLSRLGRRICTRIEERTGTPTFYFLLNNREWSTKQDLARMCPGCGKGWFIAGSTIEDRIAFKCDNCRLVSERSPTCRDI